MKNWLKRAFSAVCRKKEEESTVLPRKKMLENGVKIGMQYAPRFDDMITGSVLVHAGSVFEPNEKRGLAHFLEHVLVDHEIVDQLRLRGGRFSAKTNGQYIRIDLSLPWSPGNEDFTARSLASLVIPRKLDDGNFNREKLRIINEIARYRDNPEHVVFHTYLRQMFDQPCALACDGGTPESLSAVTREDLELYMQTYFNGSNTAVVVKTPYAHSMDQFEQKLADSFSVLPEGLPNARVEPEYQAPDIRMDNDHLNQLYFVIAFNVDTPDAGTEAVALIYKNYLELLAEKEFVNAGLGYCIQGISGYDTNHAAYHGIAGDIHPDQSAALMPAIAKILGESAHTIDEVMFMRACYDARQEFIGGAESWQIMRAPHNMAQELLEDGYIKEPSGLSQALSEVTIEDLKAYVRDRVLSSVPAIIAYGNHSNFQNQQEFAMMVEKAATPDSVLPVSGAHQKKTTQPLDG